VKHTHITTEPSGKIFYNANGTISPAEKVTQLNLPLRLPALRAEVVPGLALNSLLSSSKCADANYITLLTPDDVAIFDAETTRINIDGTAVLKGWRCPHTKLWRVPLTQQWTNPNTDTALLTQEATAIATKLTGDTNPTEYMNNVYELPNLDQIIRWYHAAAGYPTKTTWIRAIEAGFFATWPLLTPKAVKKHYPDHDATPKGHMRRIKSGIRSTKTTQPIAPEIETTEKELRELKRKHRDIYVKVKDTAEMIYTDQTGRFPIVSSQGHKYIMFLCDVDSNYIAFEAMKSRDENEMIRTYNALLARLGRKGIKPKKQMLDNEASKEYLQTIESHGIEWELAPPGNHRRNLAERMIQTGKNHIVSNIAGCDPTFPLREWHRLLEQMELTINMLRPSNIAPNVSAHTLVHGIHDYNKMPLGPLGCQTQTFIDPKDRRTFGVHSADSWYIGTSTDHYRCQKVFIKETRAVRVTDTLQFKHKHITQPRVTAADAIVNAAHELTQTLKGNLQNDVSKMTMQELERLATIFQKAAMQVSEQSTTREAVPTPRVRTYTDEPNHPTHQPPRVEITEHTSPHFNFTENPTPRVPDNPMPPIITQDDEEETSITIPRRYSKRIRGSIATDALLAVLEMSNTTLSPSQLSKRQFPLTFLCEFAGAVMHEDTGELLEYRQLVKIPKYRDKWSQAFGKEIGRLAQGLEGVVEGTNTWFFMPYEDIPEDRRKDVTYARICVNERPEKADPNRCRITLGGNLINYPGDVGTRTADMLTVKLLLNSVISTPGSKFMSLDITNFYLMAPLKRYEYVRLKLEDFPNNVIEQYKLREIAKPDGSVFVEVRRCHYGLPQSGILANKYLEKRLNEYGYYQSTYTPGLWMHKTRSIKFALVVDDFGIKYDNIADVEHLKQALQATNPETGKPMFQISTDESGARFVGLTIDWDYENRECHISMPGYVAKALKRFQHDKPTKPQHQPYPHNPKHYGQKVQYAEPMDSSPPLDKSQKKFIQEVTGTFLFYARAVDGTMLTALSSIASEQANPTENTMKKCLQFLDYAATQEDAVVTYRKSDMVLAIHSDASYLSEPKARSRAGGHFFVSENTPDPNDNGTIHTVAKIIKQVMSSAAEAELGGLFINAKTAVPIRTTLTELGHKQPPTPIQTDNSTASGVVNNEVQPKATKAMDMRFYWLKDREAQKQFKIYWRAGKLNRGDYYTKHHPAIHHVNTRKQILTPWKVVEALRTRLSNLGRTVTSSAARVC
jgi:hypothetical protein